MNYTRRRTDSNHAKLGKVARQIDPGALDTHVFGAIGCDYLARNIKTGEPILLEFKDPDKAPWERGLTANEKAMKERYPRHWRLCMTEDDVRRALGLDVVVALDFQPADLSPLARRAKRRGSP